VTGILGQTNPPGEVIVVDDASTDRTADIAEDFEGVQVIRLAVNGGHERARDFSEHDELCGWNFATPAGESRNRVFPRQVTRPVHGRRRSRLFESPPGTAG
jgi:hypothetical protein